MLEFFPAVEKELVDLRKLQQDSEARQARLANLENDVQALYKHKNTQEAKINSLKAELTKANNKLAKRRAEVKEYHEIIASYKERCPMPMTKAQKAIAASLGAQLTNGAGQDLCVIFCPTDTAAQQKDLRMVIGTDGCVGFDLEIQQQFIDCLVQAQRQLEPLRAQVAQNKTVVLSPTELQGAMLNALSNPHWHYMLSSEKAKALSDAVLKLV